MSYGNTKIKATCKICKGQFEYYASEQSGLYCSRSCAGKTMVKNLGKRFTGMKWSQTHRKKLIKSTTGEKHWAWKGDKISYVALHRWVERHRGRPRKCSECGTTSKKISYDWANVSKKYKRDLNDFIRLCRSCHRKFDK
jgi:hypothetical protein